VPVLPVIFKKRCAKVKKISQRMQYGCSINPIIEKGLAFRGEKRQVLEMANTIIKNRKAER